jgi:hypothetical protein
MLLAYPSQPVQYQKPDHVSELPLVFLIQSVHNDLGKAEEDPLLSTGLGEVVAAPRGLL